MVKQIEQIFEGLLWNSRLLVFIGVIASLLSALAVFYMTAIDVFMMISHVLHYGSTELAGGERELLRAETIKHVVEIVDGFLLSTVLLIFSMGLYELFISKIDLASDSEHAAVCSRYSIPGACVVPVPSRGQEKLN